MPRSKKKTNISQGITAPPEQSYLVIKSGIKVYPVSQDKKWFVEVDNNGKIKRFDKVVPAAELNEALAKTIMHYYKLLTEPKDANT